MQVVTTVLKFVPLAIIGVVGLFFIDGDNLTPFAPEGTWSAISAAAPLTLWAFIGLESATVAAGEVKDPERTIPRATIIGTLAATLVYILTTVAVMGVVPQGELAASSSPFALAAGEMFGGGWDKVIALVAMIATFGALNGWIMLQGRVPLAAAEDGLFPAPFAQGARRAQDAGVRPGRLVRARLGPDAHELHAGPRRGVHVHHPAGDADDAGAVRVQRGRAGAPVSHRAGAVRPAAHFVRDVGHRRARVRLLGLGDHGLRQGHHRQGIRAAARRHPDLRRDEVVAGAAERRARRVPPARPCPSCELAGSAR